MDPFWISARRRTRAIRLPMKPAHPDATRKLTFPNIGRNAITRQIPTKNATGEKQERDQVGNTGCPRDSAQEPRQRHH